MDSPRLVGMLRRTFCVRLARGRRLSYGASRSSAGVFKRVQSGDAVCGLQILWVSSMEECWMRQGASLGYWGGVAAHRTPPRPVGHQLVKKYEWF